jgi:gliding motility-associated-like protein
VLKTLCIFFLIACSVTGHSQCINSFRLTLSGINSEFGYDVVEISGGDLIIAGETTSYGNGAGLGLSTADIFLMRMRPSGQIVWTMAYGSTGDEHLRKLCVALDGNILIAGTSNSFEQGVGAAIAMEIDLNGNIVWQNQFEETIGRALALDILSTTDNGFVVSGTDYAPDNSSDWMLAKLNASGQLVWNKRLDYTVNEDAFSLIQKGDTLIALGDENGGVNYAGVIVKLAVADGTLYGSNTFIIDSRGAFAGKIQSSSNQYRISVHIIDGYSYSQMQEGFVITDPNFNPLNYFKINAAPYDNFDFTGFFQTADGGFLATGTPAGSGQGYIFKFDATGNLTFSTEIVSGNPYIIYSAIQASDGSIWAVGSDNGHVSLLKLNSSGQFQYCPNLNPMVPTAPTTLSFSPFSWANISTYNFQPPSGIFKAKPFTFTIDSLCFEPACHIRLVGQDTICQRTDTTTITALRTGDCGANLLWSVPQGVYSAPVNDSTLRIHLPADGSYAIQAESTDPCSIVGETVQVSAQFSPDSVNLGPDTVLCNAASLPLNAGPGFQTYEWQDGSTNSTYLVTQTGVYIVSATNSCHVTYSDTVSVGIRSANSFGVSPADTGFCTPGPVTYNAKGGDTYSWSPATGLSNPGISDPTAISDTTIGYQVLIDDTVCHRSRSFTVHITVDPPPVLSLSKSNDVDCSIGSAQLTATGAVSYSWQPGVSLNSDSIPNPVASPFETTTYSVIGSNLLGCSTSDTITVYFTKVGMAYFYLPNAFTPNNDGRNDIFRIIAPGAVKIGRFSVFDRWGQLVFTTTNISQGWDGAYRGSALPAGAYVWEVSASNPCSGPMFQKGTVLLIR